MQPLIIRLACIWKFIFCVRIVNIWTKTSVRPTSAVKETGPNQSERIVIKLILLSETKANCLTGRRLQLVSFYEPSIYFNTH